ncbi:hypothetical protein EHQ05_10450 [Leptospira yasudae]|uniref:Lipoprotein n=1 Tax=Leptospira yasudae TaxID=2202201 RepID=A0ABX9LXL9_9LEPT|nr:hypothetical protein [Leptospira yasudae]RHX77613.1 hypothetical protein DLM77_20385 [Leptospira yasudae]TGK26186.1 hypothetical protein EHQ05_10450 [Leptospira yasudae]TGM08567.1 hypothetical protein EHQ86_03100 [Leptospira yasudae]
MKSSIAFALQSLVLSSALLSCSCSFLVWKNSSLSLERGWSSSGKEIVQMETLYEEKDSWNPLMGTTLKRNYRSLIRIFDPNVASQPLEQIPFSSWILPGSVYYHSGSKSVYWIGGKDDEYGSFSRIPAGIRLADKQNIPFSLYLQPGQIPIQLVPSPNGNSLALIVAVLDNDLEFLKPELIWLDRNEDSSLSANARIDLPEWRETPGHRIRWSERSDKIYIQISESVFTVHPGKKNLQKAVEFPICFAPPTSFGPVGVSPSSENATSVEKNKASSFSDSPKIRNTNQIRDCSTK